MKDMLKELAESLDVQKTFHIQENDQKLKALQSELELRQKVEIHEIEERKNQHINELM